MKLIALTKANNKQVLSLLGFKYLHIKRLVLALLNHHGASGNPHLPNRMLRRKYFLPFIKRSYEILNYHKHGELLCIMLELIF